MLKKIIAASAICVATCGISYGKMGALDIMESGLKDSSKQDIAYRCVGDDKHATCYFDDTDTVFFGFNNMRADVWLTDNQIKQEISGNINTGIFEKEYSKFIPKSFKCESVSTLQDLQSASNGSCVIKSDIATLSIESKSLLESKSFRYKTMPSIIMKYIAQIEQFSKEYDDIQKRYNEAKIELREKMLKNTDDIQTEIDMLEVLKSKHRGQSTSCCCGDDSEYRQRQAIQALVDQKMSKKSDMEKQYRDMYNNIQEQYKEEMNEFKKSIVAWLRQYDYTMKEARIQLRTNKLGAETFAIFAKNYFNFNNEDMPLTKEQKKKYAEYKKNITAQYYSGLELMRAASMTFVKQSPYLEEHLRKSLQKIIVEQAKIFDPNSHTNNLKILITPLNQHTINLGDEAQKLIDVYDNGDSKAFLKLVFDFVNKYYIKAVRLYPEQQ